MSESNLQVARERTGKTQSQVAKEISIPIRMYQRYEHGDCVPSAPTGNSIARALGTTSEKLFGYKDTTKV